jgi:hypothetical protein
MCGVQTIQNFWLIARPRGRAKSINACGAGKTKFNTLFANRTRGDDHRLDEGNSIQPSAKMTPLERVHLETLDSILRANEVRQKVEPIIARVRDELARRREALMTWESIPLALFRHALPAGIRSSWVFVLRAGADTGAERHPNSHQRMMSIYGTGDLQTEERGKWRSNCLVSDPDAPLDTRWISIPPNVWHRPVIGDQEDWVVVSFHTLPAEELIEERPAAETASGTKQMRYLDQK